MFCIRLCEIMLYRLNKTPKTINESEKFINSAVTSKTIKANNKISNFKINVKKTDVYDYAVYGP